jgi:mRNA-degrading endonuclease RelE of RelBE toxin-antitoxin system
MADYEIIPSSKFKRELKKLSEEVQKKIAQLEELQRTTPFPEGYDIKKMKGERKLWRIRLNTRYGSFRYVFLVSRRENMIIQKSIRLRKEAYR